MISTTGRSPAIAEPTPMPTIVFSEIGVSRTRFSPNSSSRPGGDLEGALEHAHVLAHDEDRLVGLHLLAQRLVERLAVAHHRHQSRAALFLRLVGGGLALALVVPWRLRRLRSWASPTDA